MRVRGVFEWRWIEEKIKYCIFEVYLWNELENIGMVVKYYYCKLFMKEGVWIFKVKKK